MNANKVNKMSGVRFDLFIGQKSTLVQESCYQFINSFERSLHELYITALIVRYLDNPWFVAMNKSNWQFANSSKHVLSKHVRSINSLIFNMQKLFSYDVDKLGLHSLKICF